MCADPLRTCKSFNGSFANGCYDFADLEEGTGQLQTGKTQTYFFTHPAWGDDDGVLDTDELWRPDCQFMSSLFRMAQEVDPHVMMIVFLPTLLFESAFAMDYAIFRKQLSQIVVLAGPGVIVASLVTGLFVKAWYSHWSFNACWLLGTIVSATDPVAVVALLKDLGADPALGTMIEGESLLNDGSAVVVYSFIMSWIKFDWEAPDGWLAREGRTDLGPEPFPVWGSGWIELLVLVLQMAVLGVVFGIVAGKVVKVALQRVYNETFIEVAIVLGSTHLVFWLSEIVLKSSAVLSVVVMGAYLNLHREAITVDTQHFLHEFYEMCAYLLNTVLFLIAGVSLGEIFYGAAVGFDDDGINDMDFWGYMPLLYAVCLFARTATVALFYPLMKFAASRGVGTKIDWRKAAVLIWGGLRGAVGLALALVVRHTEYDFEMWPTDRNETPPVQQGVTKELKHLYCRDVPQLILMATCSMIFLTVVVNGSTMARLMRALGLDQPTEDRRYMMSEAAKKLHIETDKFLEKLKKEESHLDSADYPTVQDRFLYLTNDLEADLLLEADDIAIAMAQQAITRPPMLTHPPALPSQKLTTPA